MSVLYDQAVLRAVRFALQACTADGTVYDITNIVPYVQKFKKHPVSGEPLQLRDIIQLHFHKNADNEYHDPILHKVPWTCLPFAFHCFQLPFICFSIAKPLQPDQATHLFTLAIFDCQQPLL